MMEAARKNKVRLVATNHIDAENLVENVLLAPKFVKKFLAKMIIRDASRVFRAADSVIAPNLRSAQMLEAVTFAHQSFQPIIAMIHELAAECGKKKIEVKKDDNAALKNDIASFIGDRLVLAYKKQEKQARSTDLDQIFSEIKAKFINETVDANKVKSLFKQLSQELVRNDVLKTGKRIDGRSSTDIRRIEIETGLLPQVHGSALFTRGETQALVTTTLGATGKDKQMIENLDPGMTEESFMLHYNFPPYSVGETGQMKPPGRREIGHGKLAWRALNPAGCGRT
jgi:polyribonucleotide nucleotidyltransferase